MTGTYQLASTRYFGKVLCPAMTTFRGEMHCFREEAIFSFHLLTNVQLSMNSLSQRQDITDWHCLSSMYASGSVILPRSKLETERFTEGGKKKSHWAAISCLWEHTLVYQCWLVNYFIHLHVFTLIFLPCRLASHIKPLATIIPGKAAYNRLIFANGWK